MKKLWHVTKLILIPVIGNLYRMIYQAPANVIRFLYDFLKNPKAYIKAKREFKNYSLNYIIDSMKYTYDGFDWADEDSALGKFPTYTKTVAGTVLDGLSGNCMDFAHAFKVKTGKGKLKIYIPDLKLLKIHYLVMVEVNEEHSSIAYELVKRGVKAHYGKTARQVMEERYPDNTIYKVW